MRQSSVGLFVVSVNLAIYQKYTNLDSHKKMPYILFSLFLLYLYFPLEQSPRLCIG